MSRTVKLSVINQTTDIDAANLVICQHNADAGMRANPIAWRVLREIKAQESRSFELSEDIQIVAQGAQGDTTPAVSGINAQAYALGTDASGIALVRAKAMRDAGKAVEVRNMLEEDADVRVFKADRLLAVRNGVAPGEVAAFQFHPHLYIGLGGRLEEGAVMSDAAASRITTRINLFGITSANIVMTSSEQGANVPAFHLENIQ